MAQDLHKKDNSEVHISKFGSASGGGFYKLAMNDQKFMEKVAKVLLSDNKNSGKSLAKNLSKILDNKK